MGLTIFDNYSDEELLQHGLIDENKKITDKGLQFIVIITMHYGSIVAKAVLEMVNKDRKLKENE
jgi:hypothetical protein